MRTSLPASMATRTDVGAPMLLANAPAVSPVVGSVLAAIIVATVIVAVDLHRETSPAAMRAAPGWTAACFALDIAVACIITIGAAAVYNALGIPGMGMAGALVSGVAIGCAPMAAAAIPVPRTARNRLREVRAYLIDMVAIADARHQSRYVRECAITLQDHQDGIDGLVERTEEFLRARQRQGKLDVPQPALRHVRATGADSAVDGVTRARALVQVLLDHQGRTQIDALCREAEGHRAGNGNGAPRPRFRAGRRRAQARSQTTSEPEEKQSNPIAGGGHGVTTGARE